ncbi:hypothetical protein LLH00_19640, partial [bacterium]|nr:hypothetical protein [bacterium]
RKHLRLTQSLGLDEFAAPAGFAALAETKAEMRRSASNCKFLTGQCWSAGDLRFWMKNIRMIIIRWMKIYQSTLCRQSCQS